MTTACVEKKKSNAVELPQDQAVFRPWMDIVEKESVFLVRCEVPGVDEKDLEVTLEDNVLSVTGTQVSGDLEGFQKLHGEYEVGVFHRAVTFTQDVDAEAVDARVKDGVLSLTIPKKKEEPAGKKTIKIEVA